MKPLKNGFVLIDVLISMLAFSYLLFVMTNLLIMLSTLNIEEKPTEFELSIRQLQWQIAINNRLLTYEDQYCFDYYQDMRCLSLVNNRLILTPGTQIVITGLKDPMLYQFEHALYIKGHYHEKEYTFKIWDLQ